MFRAHPHVKCMERLWWTHCVVVDSCRGYTMFRAHPHVKCMERLWWTHCVVVDSCRGYTMFRAPPPPPSKVERLWWTHCVEVDTLVKADFVESDDVNISSSDL